MDLQLTGSNTGAQGQRDGNGFVAVRVRLKACMASCVQTEGVQTEGVSLALPRARVMRPRASPSVIQFNRTEQVQIRDSTIQYIQ